MISSDRALRLWTLSTKSLSEDYILAKHLHWLSSEEKFKADSFSNRDDRVEYIASRLLLRKTLGKITGAKPELLKLSVDPYGRPFLLSDLENNDIDFNVSHTAGMVACIISNGTRCGVDIENMTNQIDIDEVASLAFSSSERDQINFYEGPCRLEKFYSLWTLKEAYLKALGIGLSINLQDVSIDISGGQPYVAQGVFGETDQWRLRSCHCKDKSYSLSIAYREQNNKATNIIHEQLDSF